MKMNKYTLIGLGCTAVTALCSLISSNNSEKKREEQDKAYLNKLYENDKRERESKEEES